MKFAFHVVCQIAGNQQTMPLVVMRPKTGVTTEEPGLRRECLQNAVCHSRNFNAVCEIFHDSGAMTDRFNDGLHEWSMDPGKILDLISTKGE